ncbi:serine hydrolase [Polynucleobacter sp. 30F-ANTBAC]|uniref:serine hydrolase n=1 Tax=Polynucleobacter sp. 30F-ANTBAC TaxID=2689095 RepID=UPI00210227D7|nr:serine hydrolase [Polynucleobacter sp. 30F-ANTBAC]
MIQPKIFLRAIFIAMVTVSLVLPAPAILAQEKKTTIKPAQKNKQAPNAKASKPAKQPKAPRKNKTVRTSTTRQNAEDKHVEKRPSFAAAMGLRGNHDSLSLKSSVALIVDRQTHEVLFEKNAHASLPIASITKLMTSLVVMDAGLPLDENLTIHQDDVNTYPGRTRSRVTQHAKMTREEALLLALMSSENRTAYALGRNYPGGVKSFVDAMNAKAQMLGMTQSKFADPTGLSSENVSSPEDLTRLVEAAYQHKVIREFSTRADFSIMIDNRQQKFVNTNRLVRAGDMDIGLQKTGYISAAGRCLVMQAKIQDRDVVMVFLDSVGTQSRFADAVRVKKWLESNPDVTPLRKL